MFSKEFLKFIFYGNISLSDPEFKKLEILENNRVFVNSQKS